MELDQLKREPDGPLSVGFARVLESVLVGQYFATTITHGFRDLVNAIFEAADRERKVADLIEAARDVTRDPQDPTALAALRVHLEYFGGAMTDGTRNISRFRKDSHEEAF